MSNRRRTTPKPPAEARAYATAYRCGHCTARGSLNRRPDRFGVWHITVAHDISCPALNGTVPVSGSGMRALATMAKTTGTTGLYLARPL